MPSCSGWFVKEQAGGFVMGCYITDRVPARAYVGVVALNATDRRYRQAVGPDSATDRYDGAEHMVQPRTRTELPIATAWLL